MSVTGSIRARGLCFEVDRAGPGDGDLVLLLHGFPQTRHTWRAELPALAGAGYFACAPDQRGYSPGARPKERSAYHVDELVDDVLAFADAFGRDAFHLVGHDWGGQVAWHVASRHPDRVRSLAILSRPHPSAFARAMRDDADQPARSGHHRRFQDPDTADKLLRDGASRFRSGLVAQGIAETDVDAYFRVLGDRAALDAAIDWYRAAGAAGLQSDVPTVEVPTLYVWGSADATVGRRAAEGTADFVSGPYRFVELPGIGHFITDQAPAAFPPLLTAHLANNAIGPSPA